MQPHVLPDLVTASPEAIKSSVMGWAPTPHPTFPEPRQGCRSSRTSSTTLDMHRVGVLPAGSDWGTQWVLSCSCSNSVDGDLSPPKAFLITALKGVKRFLPTHTWPSSGAGSQTSPWQNWSRLQTALGSDGLGLSGASAPLVRSSSAPSHTHQPHVPMKISKIFVTQPCFRVNWIN